jgi:GPH family glycoside/pentoside/hexuronide:cation symporter
MIPVNGTLTPEADRMSSQQEHLPLRVKLLYSTGDLSVSIPLTILMFFQLYFLTDVAHLRPDLAGWAVGVGRLWDAVNDPMIGLLSDRVRTRWGRRRVFLLFCAVPLGLTFMLMWVVPPLGPLGLTIYYAVTFILFDTVFTLIHVAYNALTPELAPDYDERSTLNGYRMVFSIAGDLGAIIFATVLGWYLSDPETRFLVIGLTLGGVAMIPPLVVFRVARERLPGPQASPLTWRQAIGATLGNRPFRLVMGVYLLSWTTASILAADLVYFATYHLRVPEQANYFVLVAEGSAILFIPLWVWVARRLDKRRAFILGSLSWVVILLFLAFLGSDQVGLAYVLAALSGSGIATAYVIPWAMVPDVVEYDQLHTGQRREGSYYAFASFFQKLATGLAIWAMGQVLHLTGYITPTASQPVPVQPGPVVGAIRWFMGPVPAVLLSLSILCAWFYPITREFHASLREQIAERAG